jgi:hypothetical protein
MPLVRSRHHAADATQMRVADAPVRLSTHAGDFYCGHCYFLAQQAAADPAAGVVHVAGAPLVGFLHLPEDAPARGGGGRGRGQGAARFVATSAVVAAALAGTVDAAAVATGDAAPVRVLLTGFGPWGVITDNPSGAFVADGEALDATLAAAFPALTWRPGAAGERRARVATARGPRELQVRPAVLPVSDAAIDGGPRSIGGLIAAWRPHAVLSLGVRSRPWAGAPFDTAFDVELRATDGGLALGAAPRHDPARVGHAARVLPDNPTLASALLAGASPLPSESS